MRAGALLLACLLALASPAAAQQAPPAFAASHLAAAHELLAAMRMEEASMAGMRLSMDQQIAANPAMAPYRQVMVEWAAAMFAGREAKDAFAALYAEAFTEAELRGLIAFYRSPLGERLAAQQGELARRGAEVGMRLATSHQADLMARIQAVDSAKKP